MCGHFCKSLYVINLGSPYGFPRVPLVPIYILYLYDRNVVGWVVFNELTCQLTAPRDTILSTRGTNKTIASTKEKYV